MITFLISSVSVFLIDKFVCRHFTKARWFSLHAIFNFINVLGTYTTLVHALQSPLSLTIDNSYSTHLYSQHSIWPTAFTIALHMYHVLFYTLRFEDVLHHCLFVPFLLYPISYETKNLTLFFACGFPGMLSYIALCCKKYNIITRKSERKISFYQNLWLRAPGLLFTSFSVFYSHLYSNQKNIYFVGLMCVFASINGMYYLQQIARILDT